MDKIYGVYFAYSQREVTGNYDKSMPFYPREFARVRVYNNPTDQLEAYANTMCPASQTFEANSEEELEENIKDFNIKFEDENWLEKNIYPYI